MKRPILIAFIATAFFMANWLFTDALVQVPSGVPNANSVEHLVTGVNSSFSGTLGWQFDDIFLVANVRRRIEVKS
jgi:hypothetical protein